MSMERTLGADLESARGALREIVESVKAEADGETCLFFAAPASCSTHEPPVEHRCPGCIAVAALGRSPKEGNW